MDTYLLSQSSTSRALGNISHLFFRASVIRKPGRGKKGLVDHKVLSNVKAGPGWPPIYSELLWFNLQTGCFSRLWVLSAAHVSALRYDLLHAPFISFEGRKLNWRVEEGTAQNTHTLTEVFCVGALLGFEQPLKIIWKWNWSLLYWNSLEFFLPSLLSSILLPFLPIL